MASVGKVLRRISRSGEKFLSVMSTQYKKLAPNALRFTYQNCKSCKPHEKTKQKKIKILIYW